MDHNPEKEKNSNYIIVCPYCGKKGYSDVMAVAVQRAEQHILDSHPDIARKLMASAVRTDAFKMVDSAIVSKLKRRKQG